MYMSLCICVEMHTIYRSMDACMQPTLGLLREAEVFPNAGCGLFYVGSACHRFCQETQQMASRPGGIAGTLCMQLSLAESSQPHAQELPQRLPARCVFKLPGPILFGALALKSNIY